MRIGLAQKALNLYLKYLWCLGEIHEPPHCPLDSIVLGQVPGCKDVRWTLIATLGSDKGRVFCPRATSPFSICAISGLTLSRFNPILKYGLSRETRLEPGLPFVPAPSTIRSTPCRPNLNSPPSPPPA
jgi:hypothetical protein